MQREIPHHCFARAVGGHFPFGADLHPIKFNLFLNKNACKKVCMHEKFEIKFLNYEKN
jgi:hypothetical protein